MDIKIVCKDCGQTFTFSEGEQNYFLKNKLQPPRRCKECRNGIGTNHLGVKQSSYFENAKTFGPGTSVEGGLSIEYRYYIQTNDGNFVKEVGAEVKFTNNANEKYLFVEKTDAEECRQRLFSESGMQAKVFSISSYQMIRSL